MVEGEQNNDIWDPEEIIWAENNTVEDWKRITQSCTPFLRDFIRLMSLMSGEGRSRVAEGIATVPDWSDDLIDYSDFLTTITSMSDGALKRMTEAIEHNEDGGIYDR